MLAEAATLAMNVMLMTIGCYYLEQVALELKIAQGVVQNGVCELHWSASDRAGPA